MKQNIKSPISRSFPGWLLAVSGLVAVAPLGCAMFCVDCNEGGSGDAQGHGEPNPTSIVLVDYRVVSVPDGAVLAEGCEEASNFPNTGNNISVRVPAGKEYILELSRVRHTDLSATDILTVADYCAKTEFKIFSDHDNPACFDRVKYGSAYELLEATVIDGNGNEVPADTEATTFLAKPGDIERFRFRLDHAAVIEISRNQSPCSRSGSPRSLLSIGSS